jgi:hypothetical protein
MPKSSSILNHFKREHSKDEEPESSAKRHKRNEETSLISALTLNSATKFLIDPPDFNIEYSGVKGRIVEKDPGLNLVIYKPFLSKSCARTLYKYLLSSLPWYRVSPSF